MPSVGVETAEFATGKDDELVEGLELCGLVSMGFIEIGPYKCKLAFRVGEECRCCHRAISSALDMLFSSGTNTFDELGGFCFACLVLCWCGDRDKDVGRSSLGRETSWLSVGVCQGLVFDLICADSCEWKAISCEWNAPRVNIKLGSDKAEEFEEMGSSGGGT